MLPAGPGAGRLARDPPAAAARRGGAPARPAPQQGPRRGGDQPPLRRVQRLLPHRAGPEPDLLVRGVPRPVRHPRAGPGQQVRADLPQARPAAGHAAARRRLRLGRHGACTPPSTTASQAVGVTISQRQAELAEKRVGRGRAVRPGRDPRAGLPRGGRRPLRRHQLDRHVRARGRGQAGRVLRPAAHAAAAAAAACSTTASAGPPGQGTRLPRRSFVNRYVFPDGELHEVGRVVSPSRRPGSRSATSRRCASTTP